MNISEFKHKITSCVFEHSENFWVGGGVSEEFIIGIEDVLGFVLNSDYKEFLREFGSVAIVDDFYFGLDEDEKGSYANLDVVTYDPFSKTFDEEAENIFLYLNKNIWE